MSLVGKFAIARSRFGSASIYRVDKETAQMLYVRRRVEPLLGREGYWATNALRQYKDQFVGYADSFAEAQSRVARANAVRDEMKPKIEAARATLREIEECQAQLEAAILNGAK